MSFSKNGKKVCTYVSTNGILNPILLQAKKQHQDK